MQLNAGLVWLGALLVFAGVLLTAAKTLFRGRLSGGRGAGQATGAGTLEPERSGRRFSVSGHGISLTLMGLGVLAFLLAAMT